MLRIRKFYEQFRSLIILLGLVELGWISYWLLKFGQITTGYLITVMVWIIGMLGWMMLASYLGKRGIYLRYTHWFSTLIGLSLVLISTGILFGAFDVGREGLLSAVAQVPAQQFVWFHILRLLAIGTLIKYFQGQFPLHFMLLGSVPDFLFAVSAVALSFQASPAPGFLTLWHIIGIAVFSGAGISMFFSVPSLLCFYHTQPDSSIAFQFPMLLAPNFTVPLFMVAHSLALVQRLAL